MIGNCINQYKQSSEECDAIARWVLPWVTCSSNNQDFSYTSTARRTSLCYLTSGLCCWATGHALATSCLIPGAIAITSSEASVCAISIIHACRRTCLPPKDLTTKPMSMSDREVNAVNLSEHV